MQDTVQGYVTPTLPAGDTVIDRKIHDFIVGPVQEGINVPPYSSSMDAIVALCEEKLPGWIFRLCRCHLTDDAWLMPDTTHPEYGQKIEETWPGHLPNGKVRDYLDHGPGLDASFRNSGSPAMALCAVLVEVVTCMKTGRERDEMCPAFFEMVHVPEQEYPWGTNYTDMTALFDRLFREAEPFTESPFACP